MKALLALLLLLTSQMTFAQSSGWIDCVEPHGSNPRTMQFKRMDGELFSFSEGKPPSSKVQIRTKTVNSKRCVLEVASRNSHSGNYTIVFKDKKGEVAALKGKHGNPSYSCAIQADLYNDICHTPKMREAEFADPVFSPNSSGAD